MTPAGSLTSGVRVLYLSHCLICTQKDGGKLSKTGRFFPGRLLKRDKHILAGYNVAYHFCLNFTDTSITQMCDSFDDRLLNVSLAVQRHVAIP